MLAPKNEVRVCRTCRWFVAEAHVPHHHVRVAEELAGQPVCLGDLDNPHLIEQAVDPDAVKECWEPAVVEVLVFSTSPDHCDPECLCSVCDEPFVDVPIRCFHDEGYSGESRFHLRCFERVYKIKNDNFFVRDGIRIQFVPESVEWTRQLERVKDWLDENLVQPSEYLDPADEYRLTDGMGLLVDYLTNAVGEDLINDWKRVLEDHNRALDIEKDLEICSVCQHYRRTPKGEWCESPSGPPVKIYTLEVCPLDLWPGPIRLAPRSTDPDDRKP